MRRAKAKADGDSTDYASSNAVGAFATHWQRVLSITNLTSHGATLDAVGRTTYSETARARMAAAQQAWGVGAEGGGDEGGGAGGSGGDARVDESDEDNASPSALMRAPCNGACCASVRCVVCDVA